MNLLRLLAMYELDLTVPCGVCAADVFQPCAGLDPRVVHFARRIRRLLAHGRDLTDEVLDESDPVLEKIH